MKIMILQVGFTDGCEFTIWLETQWIAVYAAIVSAIIWYAYFD